MAKEMSTMILNGTEYEIVDKKSRQQIDSINKNMNPENIEKIKTELEKTTKATESNLEKINSLTDTYILAVESEYNSTPVSISDTQVDTFKSTSAIEVGNYIGNREFLYPGEYGGTSNGYLVYVVQVSSGNLIVLDNDYNFEQDSANRSLFITDSNYNVTEIIPFENLNKNRVLKIKNNGYIYLACKYGSLSTDTVIFDIKVLKESVTSAKVGQILKIKEVDDNGVPTKWEATDKITEEDKTDLVNAVLEAIPNGNEVSY